MNVCLFDFVQGIYSHNQVMHIFALVDRLDKY